MLGFGLVLIVLCLLFFKSATAYSVHSTETSTYSSRIMSDSLALSRQLLALVLVGAGPRRKGVTAVGTCPAVERQVSSPETMGGKCKAERRNTYNNYSSAEIHGAKYGVWCSFIFYFASSFLARIDGLKRDLTWLM